MKKALKYIITALIWLGIWQVLSMIANLEMLLPSPAGTFKALISIASTEYFWRSILYTLIRIAVGFLLGCVIGSLPGFITFFSRNARTFFSPLLHIIKATPVASFIILALVWMKSTFVPSFISALIVIPFVWSNVSTGLKSADPLLLEASRAFAVPMKKQLKNIYFPAVKPYLLSAFSTAAGLAWKAGVAAEVICYPPYSIGKGIYNSKIYLETPELFAWTATVIILSVGLEKLILFITKRTGAEKG